MASQVPYSGDPTVAPQLDPLPQVHVDTPIAAFGGATAGAITHMGEVVQGAGKELFDRAYAMQEMNEQVKADSASADAMDKMTDRYLQYAQLRGQERIDGSKAYQDDLDKIRNDGMNDLTSPYAKMAYLRDTRRTQSMMVWHGGMLARQGMDDAEKQGSLAKIDSLGNTLATLNVTDGPNFNNTINSIKQAAANHVHDLSGFEPGTPDNDNLAAPYLSKQIAKVAISRSNANPADGKAFFEKMTSGDHPMLLAEDADIIKGRIDSAVLNKTAATIAHTVNVGTDTDTKPAAIAAKARDAASKADPGNGELADNAEQRAVTLWNTRQQVEFKSEQMARSSLLQTIDGVNSKDGKVPVSIEAAEASDPDFKGHFLELSPESQSVVLEQIRKNQSIGGVVHNPQGDLQYYKLMQIGINRNSGSTPEELNDLTNADLLSPQFSSLTREQRQGLLKVQGEVINGQIQNPNMTHALTLGSVQQLLTDAGIDKRSNPDEYNKFQTAYHDAIVGYGLGAERSVKNDKELTDIASGLINKNAGSWFGGLRGINTKQPFDSMIEFSPQAKKAGTTAFRQQYNREPDFDSEADSKLVNDLAMRMIYMKYGQGAQPIKPKSTDRVTP
jgi:hypothetical protein